MMTHAHTPGPWGILQPERFSTAVQVEGSDGWIYTIADCDGNGLPEGDRDANANRIVAAVNACEGIPTEALEQGVVADLLAALEAMVRDADRNQRPGGGSDVPDSARAAIAKAKGGAA